MDAQKTFFIASYSSRNEVLERDKIKVVFILFSYSCILQKCIACQIIVHVLCLKNYILNERGAQKKVNRIMVTLEPCEKQLKERGIFSL